MTVCRLPPVVVTHSRSSLARFLPLTSGVLPVSVPTISVSQEKLWLDGLTPRHATGHDRVAIDHLVHLHDPPVAQGRESCRG